MMAVATVRARRASPEIAPRPIADPDIVSAYAEDASGQPSGTPRGLIRPESDAQAAAFLRQTQGRGVAVLPQAARSSLTGGAIPHGEVVISVERLRDVGPIGSDARITVGAGVRLRELQSILGEAGWYFPPVPTYQDAMVGGAVATDAGGAATFKYGKVRRWVDGLRVVLFNGDVLEIERGAAAVARGGRFRIELSDGRALDVPTPRHILPDLPKLSAGYHSADPFDLVDLFVGSEGTLGLITAATLRLVRRPQAIATVLAFARDMGGGMALAGALRDEGLAARRAPGSGHLDVRSIEIVDGRGLALLREHGDATRLRVDVPIDAGSAVLFEVEAPAGVAPEDIDRWLARHVSPDAVHPALPGDAARAEALAAFREAVPQRVNEILASYRARGIAVSKSGGDLVVPFGRLGEFVQACERVFDERALPFAIWGHASDGNLHPNAIPRSVEEGARAADAQRVLADVAIAMGGAPLSEHGVGRSPLKQAMLARFLGEEAIEGMRRVKRALDPEGRFAPGVLFAC